jgi:hypothetical protein
MSEHIGYEKTDVNVLKVAIPLILSGLVIVISLVILDQYFFIAKEKVYYDQVLKPESAQLKDLRQKENQTLSTYKIVDQQHGVYQIPIERAMELEVLEHSK